MRFHRRVALLSSVALFGLLAFAGASNNAPAKGPRLIIEKGLREKVRNAHIEGCGG